MYHTAFMCASYRTIIVPYPIPYTVTCTYRMTGVGGCHKRHVSAESYVPVCTILMQINDLAMELLDSKGLLCGTWENGKGTLTGSPSADPLHPGLAQNSIIRCNPNKTNLTKCLTNLRPTKAQSQMLTGMSYMMQVLTGTSHHAHAD